MEEKKFFYKRAFALIIPMALQNLINVGVVSADVIMLGKVSETVLSASSLAGQVYFVLSLIYFGLTSGAAVLTAQYWGKGDVGTIEKVMGISFRVGLITGALFTAAAWSIPRQLMMLLTNEEPVIQEGIKYLRIVSCSYIISGVTMVYLNIMRSIEHVNIGTIVYFISFAANVILNAIFIFGLCGLPSMGIEGAALGTLLARVIEITIIVFYDKKINHTTTFHLRDVLYRERWIMKDFAHYAAPVLLNELAWGMGMATITAIIGHLGQAAVAANSVAQVTRQLATVVSFGVSGAAAVILGKTIGEGRIDLAKLFAKRFIRLSLVMGLVGAVVVLGVSPIAQNFLTLSDVAKQYLSSMMIVISYFVVAQSVGCTLIVGVFRAGGDTRIGLVLDVTAMWCISILFGALAAFVWKLPVAWVYVILVSDELIKLPFSYWRYRSYRWLKNITR